MIILRETFIERVKWLNVAYSQRRCQDIALREGQDNNWATWYGSARNANMHGGLTAERGAPNGVQGQSLVGEPGEGTKPLKLKVFHLLDVQRKR